MEDYSTPDFQLRVYGKNFLPETILSPEGFGLNGRKLRVLSAAHVFRVLLDKNMRATSVEYVKTDEKGKCDSKNALRHLVKAKRKIILGAGTAFSSAILQHSGIGDPTILAKAGVSLVLANPLVGTGMKEHYGILAAFTNKNQAANFNNFMFSVTDNPQASGIGNTGKRQFLGYWIPFAGALPLGLLSSLSMPDGTPVEPTSAINTVTMWNMRPKSSGTAYIVDSTPTNPPNIQFNLFSDTAGPGGTSYDMQACVDIYKTVKQIAGSTVFGATPETMVFPPPSHFTNDKYLKQDAWGGVSTFTPAVVSNHYCGTCVMGTNISNSVVNSADLHVHGVKDLMVVDLSILPFPPTGNTSNAAYIIGLVAAKILGKVNF
jgi:choline dehydrogenase